MEINLYMCFFKKTLRYDINIIRSDQLHIRKNYKTIQSLITKFRKKLQEQFKMLIIKNLELMSSD